MMGITATNNQRGNVGEAILGIDLATTMRSQAREYGAQWVITTKRFEPRYRSADYLAFDCGRNLARSAQLAPAARNNEQPVDGKQPPFGSDRTLPLDSNAAAIELAARDCAI
jgi:hypothetical protein